MDMGSQMLGQRHVLAGVPETLNHVQIEGTFPGIFYFILFLFFTLRRHQTCHYSPSNRI